MPLYLGHRQRAILFQRGKSIAFLPLSGRPWRNKPPFLLSPPLPSAMHCYFTSIETGSLTVAGSPMDSSQKAASRLFLLVHRPSNNHAPPLPVSLFPGGLLDLTPSLSPLLSTAARYGKEEEEKEESPPRERKRRNRKKEQKRLL